MRFSHSHPGGWLPTIILAVLLTLIGSAPGLAAAPPSLSSQYYCLIDGESGQPILGKNAYQSRPVASTTKMMTAILAVEYDDLDETAIVSPHADKTAEYTIGLIAGQRITIRELLKAAMIKSANDAAVVLAEHTAGDEVLFAHLMSKKSFAIGAMQTRFKNASGLPDPNHLSTAYDLALIGRYALTRDYVRQLAATRETTFKHPGYLQPLTIRNTNTLLTSYSGADGIKTGTTDAAGKCLVASASRHNRQMIAVVLKSGDRQVDSVKLLNYGFQTERQPVVENQLVLKTVPVIDGQSPSVDLVAGQELWLWMGANTPDVEKKVRLNYNLFAPLNKGQFIGEMDLYVNGRYYESIPILTKESVAQKPWLCTRVIQSLWSKIKTNIPGEAEL